MELSTWNEGVFSRLQNNILLLYMDCILFCYVYCKSYNILRAIVLWKMNEDSVDIMHEIRIAQFKPYIGKLVTVSVAMDRESVFTRLYQGKLTRLESNGLILFSKGESKIKYKAILSISELNPCRPPR